MIQMKLRAALRQFRKRWQPTLAHHAVTDRRLVAIEPDYKQLSVHNEC